MRALQLYQEVKSTEIIPEVLKLVGTLSSIGTDVTDVLPEDISVLASPDLSLEKSELQSNITQVLSEHTNESQEAVAKGNDEKGRDDTFDSYDAFDLLKITWFDWLGTAFHKLGLQKKAFLYGERAVNHCQQIGAQKYAFLRLAEMQDKAAQLHQMEKSIAYGERCVRIAPPGTEPSLLAVPHERLAALYLGFDREVDAISHLHRAAELYNSNDRSDVNAGECLLDAATIEMKTGKLDEAQEDLEITLTLPSNGITFWYAEVTLAKLLFFRSRDLSTAVRWADEAVQDSLIFSSFPMRAVSFETSGVLHLMLGNIEKALSRFEALLGILADNSAAHAETLSPRPLYIYLVVPPSKATANALAWVASARLGRVEDAQHYWKQYEALAVQEPTIHLPKSTKWGLNTREVCSMTLSRGWNWP